MEPTDPSEASRETASAVSLAAVIFAVLWALHVQADYASYRSWWISGWSTANVAASLWLLLRPDSLRRLALSATVYATTWVAHLPALPNHEAIGSFVALAVVIGSVATWRAGSTSAEASAYERFAPVARLVLLLMYFWAAFHKVNRDFLFSADVSCAAMLYDGFRGLVSALPSVPDWFDLTMAWGTLGVEAGIPLLLLAPRTRLVGIALGWGFHLFLSFNPASGFYNFTSLLMPLFLLYAPPAFYVELRALVDRIAPAAVRRDPGRWRIAGVVVIVLTILVASDAKLHLAFPRNTGLIVWALWSLPLTALVFEALRRSWGEPAELIGTSSRVPRLAWSIPLLLAVWGATPYLGLKTENSLAMFSNLRTEAWAQAEWNHLLVPERAKLFGYQDDAVQVLAFERQGQLRRPSPPLAMPYEELRSWLLRREIQRVRYVRGGKTTDATRESDTSLFAPSFWGRRLLTFRSYEPPGAMPCVH